MVKDLKHDVRPKKVGKTLWRMTRADSMHGTRSV